ncbi:coadhesin-like [Hydractinia symbiolongicarpus]|uniref:coadhesin-like n=1 Tax=Hydractinia symbiolongicarpus TaxID=13093 RepID=UPI00254C0DDD|nr:coadhesin-like [Hydractinia symbiolongicarpus]
MNKPLGIVIFFLCGLAAGRAPPEKCERTWKKIGCFHDRIIPDRPYPYELVNHRDPINPNWDSHLLDWKEWSASLHALACKCYSLAKEKGFRYFGLQFYGECWSGPSERYFRDGPSTKCIGNDFKSCNKSTDTECVGAPFTNYIYDTQSTKEKQAVPGGWSEWSSWSACSRKCGGGLKERMRTCTNPKPTYDGSYCEGEGSDSSECNTERCEPVCQKKLEIGVITDASTSVTSKNYRKVKQFVVDLTKEFKVGQDGVHFGMIHFSWGAHLDFTMKNRAYWNPYVLEQKILSSKYSYGGTRTDKALLMAEKEFFCDTCGNRVGVPKVLIVITDGKSSSSSAPMTIATQGLKNNKVTIISMGIGHKIDEEELVEIATDKEHVFVIDDFNHLIDKLNAVLKLSCEANALRAA